MTKVVCLTALMVALCNASCASRVVPISKRGLSRTKEGGDHYYGNRRPIGQKRGADVTFIKRSRTSIKPNNPTSTTGSLYNLNDARNHLFTPPPRGRLGEYVTIDLNSTRLSDKEGPPTEAKGEQNPDKPPENAGATQKDDLEATLLKALPNFGATPEGPSLIKRFKMRIIRTLDNGDRVGMYTRSSTNDRETKSLRFIAKISSEGFKPGRRLSTDDLSDIDWIEVKDNAVTERKSLGWEDEYSLRLSGFSEAKSKVAMELEDKRERLKKLRNQLETRAKTVGQQRLRVAKERDRLSKEQLRLKEKFAQMNTKISEKGDIIEEQKKTIQEQKSLIEELENQEEKPGDTKEGS